MRLIPSTKASRQVKNRRKTGKTSCHLGPLHWKRYGRNRHRRKTAFSLKILPMILIVWDRQCQCMSTEKTPLMFFRIFWPMIYYREWRLILVKSRTLFLLRENSSRPTSCNIICSINRESSSEKGQTEQGKQCRTKQLKGFLWALQSQRNLDLCRSSALRLKRQSCCLRKDLVSTKRNSPSFLCSQRCTNSQEERRETA